jgi:hypothetical protein
MFVDVFGDFFNAGTKNALVFTIAANIGQLFTGVQTGARMDNGLLHLKNPTPAGSPIHSTPCLASVSKSVAGCQREVLALFWVRPYLVENTVSRPICEVKQPQA